MLRSLVRRKEVPSGFAYCRHGHTLSSIVDHLPQSVAKFHVSMDHMISISISFIVKKMREEKHRELCVQEIVADTASGCHVWDTSGRKLMDLTSGIGVTSTGHSHPKVVQAIHNQANKIIFAQQNILPATEASISLIHHLKEIVPAELNRFFFCNSGSEAVDNALKVARSYTGKQNIISMNVRIDARGRLASILPSLWGQSVCASPFLYAFVSMPCTITVCSDVI